VAKLSQAQIAELARQAGMSDPVTMSAIAMAESGGRTTAHNPIPPDNSYGLWQINMLGAMGPSRRRAFGISRNEDLYDPQVNARAAKQILDQQGLKAWSTYTNGAYRKYMPGQSSTGLTQASWDPLKDFWDDLLGKPKRGPGSEQWEEDMGNLPGGDLLPDTGLGDVATGIGTIAEAVQKTAAWMGNSKNWVRVAYVGGGALLAGMGLSIIARPAIEKATPAARAVKKVAGKVTK
jgi:hypothetical protein